MAKKKASKKASKKVTKKTTKKVVKKTAKKTAKKKKSSKKASTKKSKAKAAPVESTAHVAEDVAVQTSHEEELDVEGMDDIPTQAELDAADSSEDYDDEDFGDDEGYF